jgi:Cu/Ag efflux protein CusF
MTRMHKQAMNLSLLATALLIAGTAGSLSLSAAAQAGAGGHDAHHAAPTGQSGDWVDAEVRRVDPAGKKLTLKHGAIKHLDMPPMTMVFSVADGAATAELLASLKPGDQVKVQVAGQDGKTIVTALKR